MSEWLTSSAVLGTSDLMDMNAGTGDIIVGSLASPGVFPTVMIDGTTGATRWEVSNIGSNFAVEDGFQLASQTWVNFVNSARR